MKKSVKSAVAGAVGVVLGSVVCAPLAPGLIGTAAAQEKAQAQEQEKGTVSAAAGKDLQAAQAAIKDKKFSEALAALDKVAANPHKNDYDEYVMNDFYAYIYSSEKKTAEAEKAVEFLLNSKYLAPGEVQTRVIQAASFNYQLKNYDKAIEYGNRAIQGGYATDQIKIAVAQAYYLKQDYAGTDKFVTTLVNDQIKAGGTPAENTLEIGLSAAQQLNDAQSTSRWYERLVTYYPKPEYWQNVLDPLFRAKMSDADLLQVYRLDADVGALQTGSEFTDMAQLALDAGSPGEAVSVLQKGFDINAFTQAAEKNRNTHLLDSAKKQAASDEPSLAKTEAQAANASTGELYVGVGLGYLSYKQYDRAAQDLAAGLAKGGLKNAANAQLLLGIAQLKAGNKESAIKSFHAVKGDPTLERLASLWVLHARNLG